MEPIISPWLIYVVGILLKIKCLSAVICVMGLLALGFTGVGYVCEPFETVQFIKPIKKIIKIGIVITIFAIVLTLLIPDEKTMIAMIGASYVTPDNIQAVQGNIVDFVHQIAQAIK